MPAAVVLINVGDPKRSKILTSKRLRYKSLDAAKQKVVQLKADMSNANRIVSIEDDRGHEFSFPAELLISISIDEDSGQVVQVV